MSICVYDNPRSWQREVWINGKIRTADDAELWYRYGTDRVNGAIALDQLEERVMFWYRYGTDRVGPWSGNAWRPGQLQGLPPAGCALAALLNWQLPPAPSAQC